MIYFILCDLFRGVVFDSGGVVVMHSRVTTGLYFTLMFLLCAAETTGGWRCRSDYFHLCLPCAAEAAGRWTGVLIFLFVTLILRQATAASRWDFLSAVIVLLVTIPTVVPICFGVCCVLNLFSLAFSHFSLLGFSRALPTTNF